MKGKLNRKKATALVTLMVAFLIAFGFILWSMMIMWSSSKQCEAKDSTIRNLEKQVQVEQDNNQILKDQLADVRAEYESLIIEHEQCPK